MDNAGYQVSVSEPAWRDFYNQLVWLAAHRTLKQVEAFEAKFYQLTDSLAIQPYRWQKEVIAGRPLRRAVIEGRWIVLYEVYPSQAKVLILALRGAKEDWMNTPVSE